MAGSSLDIKAGPGSCPSSRAERSCSIEESVPLREADTDYENVGQNKDCEQAIRQGLVTRSQPAEHHGLHRVDQWPNSNRAGSWERSTGAPMLPTRRAPLAMAQIAPTLAGLPVHVERTPVS